VTRIYLLLLGDRPSSFVAKQVLDLITISLNRTKSFSRKFELVSGWTILNTVLPLVWDVNIHSVAFRILLDRTQDQGPVVACPYILPAILSSLNRILVTIAQESPLQGVEANENGMCCGPFGGRYISPMDKTGAWWPMRKQSLKSLSFCSLRVRHSGNCLSHNRLHKCLSRHFGHS
jgi:hypothetical protein